MPRRAAVVLLFASSALLLASCIGSQKVDRRYGAHVERGRAVSPNAYAWYARARSLHRQGQLDLARTAYGEVLAADPKSGAAWAGLAATYCEVNPERARATFDKGLRRATETLPLLLAHTECELALGQPDKGLVSARRAFRVDPASPEASALLVRTLTAAGQRDEATRVERGQRLYHGTQNQPRPPTSTWSAVDLALRRGDLVLAEALSLELMTRTTLAARALALGRSDYAAEQATLVAAAAPTDTAAWAVLWLTGATRTEPQGPPSELGALVTCLWAEQLRTAVGTSSTTLFLNAALGADESSTFRAWQAAGDPLLADCAARLERATSAPP